MASASTVQWTGGGDGTTWSDAGNWWDGSVARVPGVTDTVLFDSSATLPPGLQDINLTGDASVNDILFQGTGAHAFRISSGNASKLTLNESTAVKILVAQNSTVNAEFDLELSLLNGSNRDIRNRGTGTVTLRPNVTTDPNDYTFRFLEGNHAMNSTLVTGGRIRLATNATVTTNQSGGFLSGGRPEIDFGSTMLFQSNAISSDDGNGRVRLRGTGTGYLGASGNDDVRFQIGRFEPDQVDNTFEIVANPNGNGNLTVAVTLWNEGGQFVTIPGSTIELSTDMEAAANPGISGGGNLLVNATGTFTLTEGGLITEIREIAVEDGVFSLAGGRVQDVQDLSAANATLGFVLFGGDVDATLLDFTGTANVTDTTLQLSLATGFSPVVGDQFTLLSATIITGASAGGSIFQYTDGEEFATAGQLFRIDYINGNDAILLTVIPEPQTAALIALFGFLALCQRARSKRRA